jgi:hypothetical protein
LTLSLSWLRDYIHISHRFRFSSTRSDISFHRFRFSSTRFLLQLITIFIDSIRFIFLLQLFTIFIDSICSYHRLRFSSIRRDISFNRFRFSSIRSSYLIAYDFHRFNSPFISSIAIFIDSTKLYHFVDINSSTFHRLRFSSTRLIQIYISSTTIFIDSTDTESHLIFYDFHRSDYFISSI